MAATDYDMYAIRRGCGLAVDEHKKNFRHSKRSHSKQSVNMSEPLYLSNSWKRARNRIFCFVVLMGGSHYKQYLISGANPISCFLNIVFFMKKSRSRVRWENEEDKRKEKVKRGESKNTKKRLGGNRNAPRSHPVATGMNHLGLDEQQRAKHFQLTRIFATMFSAPTTSKWPATPRSQWNKSTGIFSYTIFVEENN